MKKWGGLAVIVFFLGHPYPSEASISVTGVSLGVTNPTAMGNSYQALSSNTPIGFQAETWMDASFIAHDLQFHGALSYEPLMVRNFSNLSINTVYAFAGLQIQRGEYGEGLAFFFSLDFGAMYDAMSISGTTSATANSGLSFATQAVPGADIAIYGRWGLVIEVPVKVIFVRSALVMVDPAVSVRFKL